MSHSYGLVDPVPEAEARCPPRSVALFDRYAPKQSDPLNGGKNVGVVCHLSAERVMSADLYAKNASGGIGFFSSACDFDIGFATVVHADGL